jgi:START domain
MLLRTCHHLGRILAALCLLPWCALAGAADDEATGWVLRHRDDAQDTRVYLLDRGDALPAFRVLTQVSVRLSALTAVLLDREHMPEWVYRTRRVQAIGASQPTEGVSQVITAMPWPLRDREAVVAWKLEQDPHTGAVTIDGHSAPDSLPPSDAWVRMPTFESRWRFTPRPDGTVEVLFEGLGDPGGNLNAPLLRQFMREAVWQAPLQTVLALRQRVGRAPYRDAVLPFITEPDR